MNRMISIDLNSPAPSLTRKFQFNQVGSSTKIYDKYFHKRIAKIVSVAQLIFAVVILLCQLSTTGLLIGPMHPVSDFSALSTSDKIGLGIWTSIGTTLAAGATFWAINKANFFRLHSSMLLNFCSFVGYISLEYFLLFNTIPRIQERIYILQQETGKESTLEVRRLLLKGDLKEGPNIREQQLHSQMQAELPRLYAALVLTILMTFFGIFQFILHLFMSIKTGRAICLGRAYFEGQLFQMQTIGRCWRNKSFRTGSTKGDGVLELPKLERSDALPPPPYESGYFHPSLTA